MEFRILGTFEVTSEDLYLTPTAPKQRCVLALLALHHGGLVPVPSLIEEIWPDNPPASAPTTLQTYIYQLRKLLSAAGHGHDAVLATRPLGYLARVSADSIDAVEFERLSGAAKRCLDDGNPGEASDLLHQANRMWRGDALCDVQRGPLLDAHAAKLNEARLEALVMQADADLRLGRHRELVGELRGLTSKHPLHEDLHGKLMLSLYRADRRSQALEVYHDVRRRLDLELGIDPSPMLQQLHQHVLSDAPDLRFEPPAPAAIEVVTEAPRTVPAQLPADLADFAGRTAELSELDSLLTPDGQPGRMTAVTGMPGCGKTALAVHAAHAARSRFPDGQLYAELSTEDDPAAILGGFLTGLGVPAAQLPDGVAERAKLFRTRTAEATGLLVLDGVTSAAQIRPLLPAGAGWQVLLTARRLPGSLPGVTRLPLEPLSTEDGVAMLAEVSGVMDVRRERPMADAVVRRCGGLPLALRALGERLAVNRHWPIAKLVARTAGRDGLHRELSQGGIDLDDYFATTLADLDPLDWTALGRLCDSGHDRFTVRHAAVLLEVSEETAEDVLDRLTAATVLRVRAFPHGSDVHYTLQPLFRDFVGAPVRKSLHVVPAPVYPMLKPVAANS